jgi:hypothetical protein
MDRSRKALAVAALFVATLAPAAALARDRILSDERHLTRFAYPRYDAPAREAPHAYAHRIVALHRLTEDGFPEVYLVLREHTDSSGRDWVQLRLPMRPNGTTAWVRRSALGSFHVTHLHLVIDRTRLRAILYDHGNAIWTAPVGIGKPSTPTPRGRFWVREKFRVAPGAQALYGTYAFGTSDYSVLSEWPGGGVVGLHGTGEPWLVPGRPSHGCVRMHNADIGVLYRLMPVGTPILVR